MKTLITICSLIFLVSCQEDKQYSIEQSVDSRLGLTTYICNNEGRRSDIVYSSSREYTVANFDSIQEAEYNKAIKLASKFEKLNKQPTIKEIAVDIKAMPLESDTITF